MQENRVATLQSLSGTGSLRVAAEFIAKFLPGKTAYLSNPTWGNHKVIESLTRLPQSCADAAQHFRQVLNTIAQALEECRQRGGHVTKSLGLFDKGMICHLAMLSKIAQYRLSTCSTIHSRGWLLLSMSP